MERWREWWGLIEVEEEHWGLWQALSIQKGKALDKCVPCSTLKPSQVESVKWLLATSPKAKLHELTIDLRGQAGGDVEEEEME